MEYARFAAGYQFVEVVPSSVVDPVLPSVRQSDLWLPDYLAQPLAC